ncbi:hypothetical protein Lfu02_76030 [Longispora fulva]|uniref:Uncharacterized protein n=1 Tax=Longispora fulva TaxID=619741 RepID=A0A8J7KW90_9ACTN|nr:hypothetical protein [Longispora fulva]MBG6136262.1 hypothetical protein [Longispora fulva]GIG63231.1 hypothetical protein Lfu02_76030 [Longispora fulva]
MNPRRSDRAQASVSSGPRRVGSWTISQDAGGGTHPDAAVSAFLTGFADLVTATHVVVDLMWLGPSREVVRTVEAQPAILTADLRLDVAGDAVVTGVYLDCAVDDTSPGTAITFYYGSVVEFDEQDRARLAEAQAMVTLTSGEWTTGHSRERLETALKEWERLTGAPIVEWRSSVHPDLVFPHGFAPPG